MEFRSGLSAKDIPVDQGLQEDDRKIIPRPLDWGLSNEPVRVKQRATSAVRA